MGVASTPSLGALRGLVVAIALTGYGLDQFTKHVALTRLDPNNPPSYLGGLVKFVLIRNPGAAFSLGSGATIVISIVACVAFLAVALLVAPRVRRWSTAVLTGLALAGIAGNLTDRLFRAPGVLRGHVVDFISFPHFAIFNVADICITCTAILLVITSFRADDKKST